MGDRPSEPIEHSALREKGLIALWLGNCASEDDLYGYLDRDFPSDFGFAIDEPAGPECDVKETPTPIRGLLEGFSAWRTFVDEATAGAKSAGWETATTAVVFHALRYRPELIKTKGTTPLTFIGNFRFSGPK